MVGIRAGLNIHGVDKVEEAVSKLAPSRRRGSRHSGARGLASSLALYQNHWQDKHDAAIIPFIARRRRAEAGSEVKKFLIRLGKAFYRVDQ